MKISVALTSYNRVDLTIRSIEQIIFDPRIDEIVVVDDCSPKEIQDELEEKLRAIDTERKVRYIKNLENLGMSRNKVKAVDLCRNHFVGLFDSDNVFTPAYLDAFENSFEEGVDIFAPEFAEPNFDFTAYAGFYFTNANAKLFTGEKEFRVLINTSNFVVRRSMYVDSYVYREDIKGSDSIWANHNMWKAGAVMKVVPGLRYFHDTEHSGWKLFPEINIKHAGEITSLIEQL